MKLVNLKSRLQTQGNRLAIAPVSHGYAPTERDRGRPWRRKRAAWLSRHPLCQGPCEAKGWVTAACIVDHVTPLWKGGADDETNYQSLCQPDHDAKTALEAAERAAS